MVINCSIPSSCLFEGCLVRKSTSSLRYRLELRTLAEDNFELIQNWRYINLNCNFIECKFSFWV